MKYLQILNGALAAMGAALGTVMGVVCLMYAAHLEGEPRLRADLPMLLAATGLFLGLGLVAGAALMAHRRAWAGRWLVQALPLLAIGLLAVLVGELRT